MIKPYASAKRRVTNTDRQGWSKRESMVALISVIVSTIGVLISAFASIVAWQQVEMLRNERMTPYRSILYSAKLESFRQIQRHLNKLNILAIGPTLDAGGAEANVRSGIKPRLAPKSEVRALVAASREFEAIALDNQVVWPEDVSRAIWEANLSIIALGKCMAVFDETRAASISVAIIEDACDTHEPKGTHDNFSETIISRWHKKSLAVREAMRKHLRADQLQAI